MKREQPSCAAKPPRKQCKKCPWKVTTDPHEIPNGYSEAKHRDLSATISEGTANLAQGATGGLSVFACHETTVRGVRRAGVDDAEATMTIANDDLLAVDAAGGWLGPCWRSPAGSRPARRVFFWCWTTGEDRCE